VTPVPPQHEAIYQQLQNCRMFYIQSLLITSIQTQSYLFKIQHATLPTAISEVKGYSNDRTAKQIFAQM
jgi:hypothetical protein